MTEQNAVSVPERRPEARPPVKGNGGKKRQAGKLIRRIVALVVAVAVVAGGGFLIWKLVFDKKVAQGEISRDYATIGSIQSTVKGSGMAKAGNSAAITLTENGTVQEVLVAQGDMVTAGQPLYTIDSQAVQDKITAAQETLTRLQEELSQLQSAKADLTIKAPFSGKLTEVMSLQTGGQVAAGDKIATLVNDSTLKLSLYYNYAYESQIRVGQTVRVSLPAQMTTVNGTVEKINKVTYIAPEGGTFFEVVITLTNPGTLTQGTAATASMTGSDGEEIYPYENGTLQFYETRDILAKAGGPVQSVSSQLMNYAAVTAGQTLVTLSSESQDALIAAKAQEVANAQAALEEATRALDNFNATSPIDGTVTSCAISPGQEVKAGDTVITISDTTRMQVEISVDDRNISFITPGMSIDLTDYNGNVYTGTVANIDLNVGGGSEGGGASGMTNYPVLLNVDNYSGTLLAGMWLDYSFVSSEVNDCVMVPNSSLFYMSDNSGNSVYVVFVEAQEPPAEVADITLPEPEPGMPAQYPTPEQGFYPVVVETGLPDTYNTEIKSGLQGDETVFNGFLTNQGDSWSGGVG